MATSLPGQLYAVANAIDQVARAHRAAASAVLRDVGLSDSAAGLLWLLSSTADCTMSQAANQLSCDRSNVTLLATQLEARGLVERTADPADARRRILHLTVDGQDVAGRLRRAIASGSPLRHLTADQCAELVTLLESSAPTDALSQPG